jgi:class 3 adenylate cyclase
MIFGEMVNIASRMEKNQPGKQYTENTYELIKEAFNCEYRGKLVKKDMMKMYFVNNYMRK